MSTRNPLRGYNHNVRHLDMVFHIQTEDSGVKAPHIFTHCFHEGTIVATKKRDYPADAPEETVRSVMKEQHKELMRELKHGAFDEKIRRYFGAQAAAPSAVEGADAAAAAAVAEVKKAAYERLLAEAKDLDSALEMELVADEPPPGAEPGADAPEWPGPSTGAKLPTAPEWPGPGEGAKLPVMPEWPGPGAGAKLPAMAAAPSPSPTGVPETSPARTSADWSSVRDVLASLGAGQDDAGLAVATYSAGDLSGPVSVVTFNQSAAGQSVKPIDLGALPPGHTLPPAPKPRSERTIQALKDTPREESGRTPLPPSVAGLGPGAIPPEQVESWPVRERVAPRTAETFPEPPAVVFHKPGGGAPAAPAQPRADLPEPPGVSLRASSPPPARADLPEPPGVSLRAPAHPAPAPAPHAPAAAPPPQSVSLRPTAPPAAPPAPASAARPPTGAGMPRPTARPAAPAGSVSMPSRPMPAAGRGEPAAPSSQQVVALKPTSPPGRAPTPARHAPRQYVSIASADGVVMTRSPVMVGSSAGAARAGTRAPTSANAAVRPPAPASRPSVPVMPARPAAPAAPAAAHPPAASRAPAAAAPPAAPARAGHPAGPPAEADSIFGAPQASEKSLHEIILSYLSGEDKAK